MIALESAVDNMGYRQIVSLETFRLRNKRILKIKCTASTDVTFLRHGYSYRLLFINGVAGKRAVNNLADITAACRSDRSAAIIVDVVLENTAGNLFYQTIVLNASFIVFENRTNGADLAIVSNDFIVVRKRAFDIADLSPVVNQGIFSVYVHLDVVNGLPAAVLYLFRPFRDVLSSRRRTQKRRCQQKKSDSLVCRHLLSSIIVIDQVCAVILKNASFYRSFF